MCGETGCGKPRQIERSSNQHGRRLLEISCYPTQTDQHVLAAAIAGHADCIVTANLRDFPAEIVGSYGIQVIHPDRFIVNQWDLDAIATMSAFKRMRARWRKPEATPEDFAKALERNGLPETGQRIREAADLI